MDREILFLFFPNEPLLGKASIIGPEARNLLPLFALTISAVPRAVRLAGSDSTAAVKNDTRSCVHGKFCARISEFLAVNRLPSGDANACRRSRSYPISIARLYKHERRALRINGRHPTCGQTFRAAMDERSHSRQHCASPWNTPVGKRTLARKHIPPTAPLADS